MLTRAQTCAFLLRVVSDPKSSAVVRKSARRSLRRIVIAEMVERAEQARRAEAQRLSDETEAARFRPFKPEGPPPVSGRRRATVFALGDDDYESEPGNDDELAGPFAVGDDR